VDVEDLDEAGGVGGIHVVHGAEQLLGGAVVAGRGDARAHGLVLDEHRQQLLPRHAGHRRVQ
jgi:hypothetical protein